MRYGRLNAIGGPEGRGEAAAPFSESGLGDAAAALGDGEGALVMGGGSIEEDDRGGFEGSAGSGKARISSSADDVSMVICLVGGGLSRSW